MPPESRQSIEPADLDWLLGDGAAPLLAEAAGAEATVPFVQRLRKATSPARAALLLEQAALRRRAEAKFSRADRMFFTRVGLEQATDEWVARHKALRFSPDAAVLDLCTGIGGDLIGLGSRVASSTGVDRDPLIARFAEQNCHAYGLACPVDSTAAQADVVDRCDAWHADPDRRPAGRRSTRPDTHEPSLETLEAWRARRPEGAVKLAPAARLPERWLDGCELEWISRARECRQLVAWSGALATHAGLRRATRLLAGPNDPLAEPATFVGLPGTPIDPAPQAGRYVFDPDPAALAARLEGALAAEHGLRRLAPGAAYLTADRPVGCGLLAPFEVVESMRLDRRRLAAWLAERKVGRLEIKHRGVELSPERLRAELKPRGDVEMTLLICPDPAGARGKPLVLAARRVEG